MQLISKSGHYQINICELIWLCPCAHNMQIISETAGSSQTKMIGEDLHLSEHGIGYLNLAFEAKKGQKRPKKADIGF